jgi:hypothetical protein
VRPRGLRRTARAPDEVTLPDRKVGEPHGAALDAERVAELAPDRHALLEQAARLGGVAAHDGEVAELSSVIAIPRRSPIRLLIVTLSRSIAVAPSCWQCRMLPRLFSDCAIGCGAPSVRRSSSDCSSSGRPFAASPSSIATRPRLSSAAASSLRLLSNRGQRTQDWPNSAPLAY